MADYPVPKNGVAYILYTSLVSQANTKTFQANPTIAAGDFKVSTDGGAYANLATLPTVTPAGGTAVKISLSAGEMTGDNIVVSCIDAAGAEWCDQVINIQTSARGIADLAYPTVSGRSLDVSAGGEAGVDWANVGSPTTALDLSGTTIKTTQKVDVETIKTQAVTCAAGVTVLASVGAPAAPGSNGGLPTVNASNYIAGIAGTKNTLDNMNDLSAAGVRTAVGLASANLDTQIAAVQADTDDIQTRIPAALTANGNMKSDVLRVNGTVQTAGDIAALINALSVYTTRVVARCTVGAASSTTSVVTSACSPSGVAADQFKGRIIVFDNDTATTSLRGQATDITASSAAATPTFTCTALTTAPSSGDTFSIV